MEEEIEKLLYKTLDLFCEAEGVPTDVWKLIYDKILKGEYDQLSQYDAFLVMVAIGCNDGNVNTARLSSIQTKCCGIYLMGINK